MITQEELKSQLHYCPDTGIFTRLVANSRRVKVGDIAGCLNDRGYIAIKVDSKLYKAHRLAWLYITGNWPENYIDHINGVKNDNRIGNLRDVTSSENNQNQRKSCANNKSGLLGVSWYKAMNKWNAQIELDGKRTHLGYFTDKHEAHNAYLTKKREIHSTCTI